MSADRNLDDVVLTDLMQRFGWDTFGINEAYPGGGNNCGAARYATLRLETRGLVRRVGGTVTYCLTHLGVERAGDLGAAHADPITMEISALRTGDRVVSPNGLNHAVVNHVINDRRVRFFDLGIVTIEGPVQVWPIWADERLGQAVAA